MSSISEIKNEDDTLFEKKQYNQCDFCTHDPSICGGNCSCGNYSVSYIRKQVKA